MKKTLAAAIMGIGLSIGAWAQGTESDRQAQIEAKVKALHWIDQGQGEIGSQATIRIPGGYRFLGEQDTAKLLELYGNPPSPDHYLIAPGTLKWFAVFSFDDTGYVKDDEKINAAELLSSMKASDVQSNKQRKKLGMETLYTEGWQVEPHYDTQSKRLEWGLRLRDESGHKAINYTSRILGRTGVMSAVLVSDPDALAQDTEEFKQVLTGFKYNSGQSYAEFRNGDKIAQIGLGALVLGGAAAVATKKGLWAVIGGFIAGFWKLLLAGAAGLLAGIGKLFGRKKDA